MNCKNMETFMNEWKRMCAYVKAENGNGECLGCELDKLRNDIGEKYCAACVRNNPYHALRIVQKWSDDHSEKPKSFLDVFFDSFPYALTADDGEPYGHCVARLFGGKCPNEETSAYTSFSCIDCWHLPYGENGIDI